MHYNTINASKSYPLDPIASINSNSGFSGRHLFTFVETTVETNNTRNQSLIELINSEKEICQCSLVNQCSC